MKKKEILQFNAYLKYLEATLYEIDNANADLTIEELKKNVYKKFRFQYPLLNQYFGLVRLLILVQIRENLKKDKSLDPRVHIIRHAISHGNIDINKDEFTFRSDKGDCELSFKEFNNFIHDLENDYYFN